MTRRKNPPRKPARRTPDDPIARSPVPTDDASSSLAPSVIAEPGAPFGGTDVAAEHPSESDPVPAAEPVTASHSERPPAAPDFTDLALSMLDLYRQTLAAGLAFWGGALDPAATRPGSDDSEPGAARPKDEAA